MISELFDISKISSRELEEIFAAKSTASKKLVLKEKLDIEGFNEEAELRKSIIVDFCLDVIVFTSDQGFSWISVQNALKFLLGLLEDTSCKGVKMEDAIHIFKMKLPDIVSDFSVSEMKSLMDHTLEKFFRHYNLYLFCMTREQHVDLRKQTLSVTAPAIPDALCKGTSFEKWKYQQTIEQMEGEQNNLQTMRTEKYKTTFEQIDQEKGKTLQELENACETLNTEDLPKILEALTKLHVDYIDSEIQRSLEDSKDKVDFTMKRGGVINPDSAKLRPASRSRPKSTIRK